jgi:hypothetical protein
MSMIAISNSEIGTADRCMREWFLKYYLGVTPTEPEITGNAILGVRVHAAMEGMYGYGLDPLAVLGALYTIAIEAFPDYRAELMAERELAEIMVAGYIEWVTETGEDAGLRVIATEQDVEVPLPGVPGVMLKARLDQVVYNEVTGLLSFLDWKTSANLERHETLALDPQFKMYSVVQLLAAGDAGGAPRVDGGMLRTLRRVKRTAKSTPPYYQHDEFRYNPDQIEAALLRIQKLTGKILHARDILDEAYDKTGGALDAINEVQRYEVPPTPLLRDCSWRCPMYQLCPMLDDGSDWPGAITASGRFRQDDPYDYYRADPLKAVRDVLDRQ